VLDSKYGAKIKWGSYRWVTSGLQRKGISIKIKNSIKKGKRKLINSKHNHL